MKVYKFTKYRIPAISISLIAIIAFWGYTIFVNNGFNFGIDFKAGMNIIADVPSASGEQDIREVLEIYNPQVQTVGQSGQRYIIRVADDQNNAGFQETTSNAVSQLLLDKFKGADIINVEYIGTSFASSLATQTIWTTLIAMGLILVYVWIRFKFNYAISSVLAIFHDTLFLLGFIGALSLEFSTATIAAVLSIIGYSLNDTIVIFDRIRENSHTLKDTNFGEIIDISVSQSLSRTLITSFTTLIAVLAILFFAAGTVQIFALSLAVGIVVGTYSSVFIASPILLALHDNSIRRLKTNISHSSQVSQTAVVMQNKPAQNIPEPIRQTALEIAEATERRARSKAKKKKKKK